MDFIVTGGAGFIGSHFVEQLVQKGHRPLVIDALTYAGHKENLQHLPAGSYKFFETNICDAEAVARIFVDHDVKALFNFAAETHVDRSISGPGEFVQTNLVGTSVLLAESLRAWEKRGRPSDFRYVQVSTDEVYGALGEKDKFTEKSPYAPNSPYSASKAGGDMLVRAWHKTYGLPTVVTHCSNNYGPRQFPEKLIPAMISRALSGEALGVYGDGKHVRDWLHVSDHCLGIWLAYEKGSVGQHYCFGGDHEVENLDLVNLLCKVLQDLKPRSKGRYEDLIQFVPDRLGHDRRYAIDFSKATLELGFRPKSDFSKGFSDTVRWYLDNEEWIASVKRKGH